MTRETCHDTWSFVSLTDLRSQARAIQTCLPKLPMTNVNHKLISRWDSSSPGKPSTREARFPTFEDWPSCLLILSLSPGSGAGHPRTSLSSPWRASSARLGCRTPGAGSEGSPLQSLNHWTRYHCWWSPQSFAEVPCQRYPLTAPSSRSDPWEVCH